jgi:hypothetical protein
MAALLEHVPERFPGIWKELRGISPGIGLDIEEVFLWNCL